jgi:hypothetical protein
MYYTSKQKKAWQNCYHEEFIQFPDAEIDKLQSPAFDALVEIVEKTVVWFDGGEIVVTRAEAITVSDGIMDVVWEWKR